MLMYLIVIAQYLHHDRLLKLFKRFKISQCISNFLNHLLQLCNNGVGMEGKRKRGRNYSGQIQINRAETDLTDTGSD